MLAINDVDGVNRLFLDHLQIRAPHITAHSFVTLRCVLYPTNGKKKSNVLVLRC